MLVDTRERRTTWLDGRAGSSQVREEGNEWSVVWKVLVPLQLKVFLWRLARQSLLTMDVLHHINMPQLKTCSICGEKDLWRHSLLECNMTRSVWELAPEEIMDLITNV
jgi:ribosomal protein L32